MKRGSQSNSNQPKKRAKTLSTAEEIEMLSVVLMDSGDPLIHIFAHLDAEDINVVNLVNKRFHSLAQAPLLWETLIEKYFPHLLQLQPNECRAAPRQLFLNEYLKFKERFLPDNTIYSQFFPLLLASLSGNLEKIAKSDLSDSMKGMCYTFAASNGHLSAFTMLNMQNKLLPLLLAGSYGNVAVIEQIWLERENLLPYASVQDIMQNIFVGALGNNHPQIVLHFLKAFADVPKEKATLQLLFSGAITFGYETILNEILDVENKNDPIYEDYELTALLSDAAAKGHTHIVKILLEAYPLTLTDSDKKDALRRTIRSHHFTTAKFLIQSCKTFTAFDIGDMLHIAVSERIPKLVTFLLKLSKRHPENSINEIFLMSALSFAGFHDHRKIITTLLYEFNITYENKILCLNGIIDRVNIEIVQLFLNSISADIRIELIEPIVTKAANKENIDLILALYDAYPEVKERTHADILRILNSRSMPLAMFVEEGSIDKIKALLNHFTYSEWDMDNAIEMAITQNNIEVLALLLHSHNPTIPNAKWRELQTAGHLTNPVFSPLYHAFNDAFTTTNENDIAQERKEEKPQHKFS